MATHNDNNPQSSLGTDSVNEQGWQQRQTTRSFFGGRLKERLKKKKEMVEGTTHASLKKYY